MDKLFTIGYEGADLDDFVETLKCMQVTLLLDVRELPMSRRKGFSKNALKDALATVDIDYRHEKRLGSPKDMRHQLRRDWDYDHFFKAFDQHLSQQVDLLEQLTQQITGHIALLCFEQDHQTCHRTPVAEALAELVGLQPQHLRVQTYDQRQDIQSQGAYLSQSFSPA